MSILKSADVCNAYWIYGAKNQILKTHLHLVSNVVNITAAAFIFQNLWLSVACRGRGGGKEAVAQVSTRSLNGVRQPM